MINIYLDESKGFKETFQIYSVIYGSPNSCQDYINEIEEIVEKNRSILKNDFNGFHSSNFKKNHTKVYQEVLQKLSDFILDKKLCLLIYLESKEKKELNSNYIKEKLKKALEQEGTSLNSFFASLNQKDYKVIYNRMEQLYIYLLHRDKFGKEDESFQFFPDETGQIIQYKTKEFSLKIGAKETSPINFFDIITRLTNALSNILINSNLEGWPQKKGHKMVKFEPQDDKKNYIVQSCDIISNFFLNYLKSQVGIQDSKSILKNNLLGEFIDLNPEEIELHFKSQLFGDNTEIICINPEMKVSIII